MNFEKKLTDAFWWAFMVFLIPSVPHMATVFRSWEPVYGNDLAGIITNGFWWSIAVLGSIVIDGTVIFLSRLIANEFEQNTKTWPYIGLLGICVVALTAFSWQMNIWYALMNQPIAAAALGAAYTSKVLGIWDSSTIMPYMVSALPLLGIMFTLMAGKIKQAQQETGSVAVMSDAEYEKQRLNIVRQQELKKLKSNGNGLLATGKEALLGKGQSDQEKRDSLLNAVVDYLRDATEFLDPKNEARAIEAIGTYLKIRSKDVLPYLIAARTTIAKEEQERLKERDTDKLPVIGSNDQANDERNQTGNNEQQTTTNDDPLAGLTGRDTVTIEQAAMLLGCQEKYVVTLRNEGKLRHQSKNDRLITVASLRQYMAKRRPVTRSTTAPAAANNSQQATPLGMIERAMFDALQNATPAQQAELRQLASEQTLPQFTATLQQRYPQQAGYITEARVARVMAAMGIEQGQGDLLAVG